MRGQAMLDYLVVLVIVLVIGLIYLALSSALPAAGQNIQNAQYATFWRSQARPFTVGDSHYEINNSRLYLALEVQTEDVFNLSGLEVNGTPLAFYQYDAAYGDGLGSLLCSASSCTGGGCSCNATLKPRSPGVLVSEPYRDATTICGPNQAQGRLILKLTYYRTTDITTNFTETGLVPLPVDCG